MFRCGRGAERGNGVMHAGLVQTDHIHVALDDHQSLQRRTTLSNFVEAVELAAFVK